MEVEKAPGAFKTIGELSTELGVAQHILRYWESKFPQLKPLQRAGNRRYYRPADVELARRINRLLNEQGYTIRGVQKVLKESGTTGEPSSGGQAEHQPQPAQQLASPSAVADVTRLKRIRDTLAEALDY